MYPVSYSSTTYADKLKNRFEQLLNIAGALPIALPFFISPTKSAKLSSQFTTLRGYGSLIQALSGFAIGTAGVIGSAFSEDLRYQDWRQSGSKQMLHGYLNGIRTCADTLSFATSLGERAILPAVFSLSFINTLPIPPLSLAYTTILTTTAATLPFFRLGYECLWRESSFSSYLPYDENAPLDKQLENAERLFRKWSIFPLVGIGSGLSHSLLGIGQTISAIAIGVIGIIGKLVSTRAIFDQNLATAKTHLFHGIMNVVGGTIEMTASASIVGSLLIFAREKLFAKEPFSPIFRYEIAKTP